MGPISESPAIGEVERWGGGEMVRGEGGERKGRKQKQSYAKGEKKIRGCVRGRLEGM